MFRNLNETSLNDRKIWMNIFESNIQSQKYTRDHFQAIHLLIQAIVSEFELMKHSYEKMEIQNQRLAQKVNYLENELRRYESEEEMINEDMNESFDSHKDSQNRKSASESDSNYAEESSRDAITKTRFPSMRETRPNSILLETVDREPNNSLLNSVVYATEPINRYSHSKFKKIEDRKLKKISRTKLNMMAQPSKNVMNDSENIITDEVSDATSQSGSLAVHHFNFNEKALNTNVELQCQKRKTVSNRSNNLLFIENKKRNDIDTRKSPRSKRQKIDDSETEAVTNNASIVTRSTFSRSYLQRCNGQNT